MVDIIDKLTASPDMLARSTQYPDAQGTEFGMERVKEVKEVEKVEKVRSAILRQANEIINKDRAATHGDAEDSFTAIAAYWSVYLSLATGTDIKLNPLDVALMMDLFKTARIHNNPQHMDNWLDKAGYTAIGGEIATRLSLGQKLIKDIAEQRI